ncbi:hypothetical protein B1R94_28875 [Mycolicibacterium litorale]|nr:hypothetical protein B1R94_28875 [Mycolicibacterium litorale]
MRPVAPSFAVRFGWRIVCFRDFRRRVIEEPVAMPDPADLSNSYTDTSFVSPWNAVPAAGTPLVVHDTTLRDGEQQAGIVFTPDEKLQIASALDEAGVNRIEAGMVAVSDDDRKAILSIVESGPRAEIWTIARSVSSDVQMAIDVGVNGVGIILLANSQYRMIFNLSLDEAIERAIRAAETARAAKLQTTLLLADAPRYPIDELRHVVEQIDLSGQFTAISLMDTFGTLNPAGTQRLIRQIREWTQIPLELHAHNDFGLATANSLAAFEAGASTIHTTVLGLGERVGNAALEEVAVAAALLEQASTSVHLNHLSAIAHLVSRHSNHPIATNKPIVGTRISEIESGTVAVEFARWSERGGDLQWLFPYVPELVGADQPTLVLGKYSGMANVDWALQSSQITFPQDRKAALLSEVKAEGIRLHRTLTTADFEAITRRLL